MASDPFFARARELYLAHDGSRFYMSRNGVEHEYLSYGVPLEVEEQWRRELVAEKIAKLSQPGNWTTMNYLCHHNDTGYLNEAVTAEPLGEPWQRVSYLELLLEYIERCACFYPIDILRNAIDTAIIRIEQLDFAGVAVEAQLRGRVRKLIDDAELIQARIERVYGSRRRGFKHWLRQHVIPTQSETRGG
jgi:hypothetical protein